MIPYRIIPCLDVRDGTVVKGVQFSNLVEMGDPAQAAERYQAQGADEIVILDVSATIENRLSHLETIRKVRERLSIPLTTGGGVKRAEDAENLLRAGADKVAVNSAAIQRPELISDIAHTFGSQCCVIAIDARFDSGTQRWEVLTHSGKVSAGIDALSWALQAERLGAGEILLTSWDRDGTGAGYDLELLKTISSQVSIPVIASGGASSAADCVAAIHAGADAVLAASIFHRDEYTVKKLKEEMQLAGVKVRL